VAKNPLRLAALSVERHLRIKQIACPHIIIDFLAEEEVDKRRLAQIINQMHTEHDLKISKHST
jgi:hypothetical protein